jgi:hypothetical protein
MIIVGGSWSKSMRPHLKTKLKMQKELTHGSTLAYGRTLA